MAAVRRFLVLLLAWALAAPVGVSPRAVGAGLPSGDPQVQASGRPYSGDCATAIPAAERLRKGLAVHEDAMRRAKAVIAAAKGGVEVPPPVPTSLELQKSAMMSLRDEARNLRAEIEKLKVDKAQSQSKLELLKRFDYLGAAASAADVAFAGMKYSQAMKEVANLREAIETTGTLMMDSGIADMLATRAGARWLGGALGGPMGIMLVQVTALGIEAAAAQIDQDIKASDVMQAQETYDAIKFQYDGMQERIQFLVENCGPAPDTKQDKKPEPEQKTAKKQPAPKQPDGKGGSNAGKVIGIAAGAAGGGLVAAYAVNKYANAVNENGGGGCDPSKAPINEVNYYCFGSTRNTSLCNQYIAQYDSFCKSCGYSRFDTATGGCR